MAGLNPLSGKTALVTGGATGIGLATVRRLIEAGARVIVLGQDDRSLVALREAYPDEPEPFACAMDVRDRAALESMSRQLRADDIRLDIVVANAGINVRMPVIDLPEEDVHRIIETNLVGVILTMQVFAPLALDRHGARFIVMGSLGAIQGYDLRAVYTASKAGLSGLVRSLAIEWGRYGATVNAVGPGIIRTPLLENYLEEHPEREASAIEHTPLGRLGEPDDVADVVMFLASSASRFITGQTIYVDGGLSAGHPWW
jgi:NAD(P)-dependent dehydrogenase (short-subunit alcohol dehydrogenase family)